MEYLYFLLNLLKTTGMEIYGFFQKTWHIKHYALLIPALSLFIFRKWQFLVLYLFGVYYFWGFFKILANIQLESPRFWGEFILYLVYGIIVFFTLCYFFFIRPRELKT